MSSSRTLPARRAPAASSMSSSKTTTTTRKTSSATTGKKTVDDHKADHLEAEQGHFDNGTTPEQLDMLHEMFNLFVSRTADFSLPPIHAHTRCAPAAAAPLFPRRICGARAAAPVKGRLAHASLSTTGRGQLRPDRRERAGARHVGAGL